jgi:hypothetical protein
VSTIHPRHATTDSPEPARRDRRTFARRIDCDWADPGVVKAAPARGGGVRDPETSEASRDARG